MHPFEGMDTVGFLEPETQTLTKLHNPIFKSISFNSSVSDRFFLGILNHQPNSSLVTCYHIKTPENKDLPLVLWYWHTCHRVLGTFLLQGPLHLVNVIYNLPLGNLFLTLWLNIVKIRVSLHATLIAPSSLDFQSYDLYFLADTYKRVAFILKYCQHILIKHKHPYNCNCISR